jgi:Mg-chelatase subunit ChlD
LTKRKNKMGTDKKKTGKNGKKPDDAFAQADRAASGNVHVVVLVDESGTMGWLVEPVVSGVNQLVESFRQGKGTARITVGFFDASPGLPRTRFGRLGRPAKKFEQLTAADYRPRGMTPLYDAIVDAVNLMDDERKGDEVGFLAIVTDGLENASETTLDGAKRALKRLTKRGDSVVFLGANIDAEGVAADLGLGKRGQSFNFTASRAGTQSTFSTASTLGSTRRYAGAGAQGAALYDAQAGQLYDETGGKVPEQAEGDDDDE